jgi:hypothetical protein
MRRLWTEGEALCRAVAREPAGRPLYVVLAFDVYPDPGNGDGPDGTHRVFAPRPPTPPKRKPGSSWGCPACTRAGCRRANWLGIASGRAKLR